MPKYTITLSHRAAARISEEVDRTNQAQGTSLDIIGWVEMHLKEIAISRGLAEAVTAIQEEHGKDSQERLEKALTTERDRRIKLLDTDD